MYGIHRVIVTRRGLTIQHGLLALFAGLGVAMLIYGLPVVLGRANPPPGRMSSSIYRYAILPALTFGTLLILIWWVFQLLQGLGVLAAVYSVSLRGRHSVGTLWQLVTFRGLNLREGDELGVAMDDWWSTLPPGPFEAECRIKSPKGSKRIYLLMPAGPQTEEVLGSWGRRAGVAVNFKLRQVGRRSRLVPKGFAKRKG